MGWDMGTRGASVEMRGAIPGPGGRAHGRPRADPCHRCGHHFHARHRLHAARRPLARHYPRAGRVEHDAGEIWQASLACAREVVAAAGGAGRFVALGICNQRQTVVAWHKRTGEPLARAIIWQDRRAANACAALKQAGHEEAVRAATGLLLDPYFSATKMRWLLDHSPEIAAGTLALGTVE